MRVITLLVVVMLVTGCGMHDKYLPAAIELPSDQCDIILAYNVADVMQDYFNDTNFVEDSAIVNNHSPQISIMPWNASPVSLTFPANGVFTELDGRKVGDEIYFRVHSLLYVAGASALCESVLPLLSYYISGGYTYVGLRDFAYISHINVSLLPSRNTIAIEPIPPEVHYPVFTVEPLPQHIIEQITGVSFHTHAPFGYDHLAYLTITHIDFVGQSRHGNMIVAASIAEEVLDIFREIYAGGFPIERMRLIDYYGADDYYSMAHNNSVAFNFRYIAGTNRLSRHAMGMAIDINPVQNPFVRDNVVLPIAGEKYLDRNDVRPGMIVPGDVVYEAFTSRGWVWGGNWRIPWDLHHFERR